MHPSADPGHFDKISAFLKQLELEKIKKRTLFPRLKIYHVITTQNYEHLTKMLNHAIDHFADSVEFQAVDIVPGKTDLLQLSKEQAEQVSYQISLFRNRPDYTSEFIGKDNRLDFNQDFSLQEQKEFGRFFHPPRNGFVFENSEHILCPRQINYIRKSWIHDHPYPAFSYEYPSPKCQTCGNASICYPTPQSIPLTLRFTNLIGIGSFLRRILSPSSKAPLDGKVNHLPCTAGWHYARILCDGTLIPCCKASKFPMGNLYRQSFPDLWLSSDMNQFRIHGLTLPKNHPYYASIQCLRGCDNLGMNLEWQKKSKLNDMA